ncbi:unnamed protein product [Moneuplotes crassus]|uniref:Uncharacterized protein n=1 Tax=Euplotes crassus TaxID=5936 RepID=A0AAD1XLD0_EUPCR|nr:unnamed protein product [Moneuplotes crassus]
MEKNNVEKLGVSPLKSILEPPKETPTTIKNTNTDNCAPTVKNKCQQNITKAII